MRLVDSTSGSVVATHIRKAHSHWTRMRGLLGTANLPPGHGLWIKPCNQIHMYFMRYEVDLLFLAPDLTVVARVDRQPVNSLSAKFATADSVVELPAGTLQRLGVDRGAQMRFDGESEPDQAEAIDQIGAVLSNLALAGLFLLFAYQHALAMAAQRQWWTILPLVLQESLLMVMFLTRRRAKETSSRPVDWIIGGVGTAAPMFLRPTEVVSPYSTVVQPLQIAGLLISVFSTISLGRSIGIVAGNRGVQSGGLHAFVRHPMYLGYLIGYAAYGVVYPSSRNIAVVALAFVMLTLRAVAEERVLSNDAEYRAYCERVRWRFLPFVY